MVSELVFGVVDALCTAYNAQQNPLSAMKQPSQQAAKGTVKFVHVKSRTNTADTG
jgi:hypothetical protein